MKTPVFILLSIFFVGCLSNQSALDYPDYPPSIIAHNLEAEFDTGRWFLYRIYGLSHCEKYNNLETLEEVNPSKRTHREIPFFEIALDTFAFRGDTVLFFYRFKIKDKVCCHLVKVDGKYENVKNYTTEIENAIAVSLSQDTVLFLAEGIHKDNMKYLNSPTSRWYLGETIFMINSYTDPRIKKLQEEDLKTFIINNPEKTHPWLLKQAKKKGWLREEKAQ